MSPHKKRIGKIKRRRRGRRRRRKGKRRRMGMGKGEGIDSDTCGDCHAMTDAEIGASPPFKKICMISFPCSKKIYII